MFIYESEYQQLTALGADTANNIEGLKPFDFLQAIGVNFQINDVNAYNERLGTIRPSRIIEICPSVFYKLVNIISKSSLNSLFQMWGLKTILGAGIFERIPIRLSPDKICFTHPKPPKGTAFTVEHNYLKPLTAWKIRLIEPNTTNEVASANGVSDANGKGTLSLTIPGTYAKPRIKIRFEQLLMTVVGNETLIDEDVWAIAEDIVTVG